MRLKFAEYLFRRNIHTDSNKLSLHLFCLCKHRIRLILLIDTVFKYSLIFYCKVDFLCAETLIEMVFVNARTFLRFSIYSRLKVNRITLFLFLLLLKRFTDLVIWVLEKLACQKLFILIRHFLWRNYFKMVSKPSLAIPRLRTIVNGIFALVTNTCDSHAGLAFQIRESFVFTICIWWQMQGLILTANVRAHAYWMVETVDLRSVRWLVPRVFSTHRNWRALDLHDWWAIKQSGFKFWWFLL